MLFKTPILIYSSQFWITTAPTHKTKIRVQNDAIILIISKYRDPETRFYYCTEHIHENANLPKLWQFNTEAARALLRRCRESDDPPIRNT
uniref:Putative secreted protein n=1 Tax=Xenopsylla cheopis TaxID=163159 RepID=A0A6M2DZ60_XENCH